MLNNVNNYIIYILNRLCIEISAKQHQCMITQNTIRLPNVISIEFDFAGIITFSQLLLSVFAFSVPSSDVNTCSLKLHKTSATKGNVCLREI